MTAQKGQELKECLGRACTVYGSDDKPNPSVGWELQQTGMAVCFEAGQSPLRRAWMASVVPKAPEEPPAPQQTPAPQYTPRSVLS